MFYLQFKYKQIEGISEALIEEYPTEYNDGTISWSENVQKTILKVDSDLDAYAEEIIWFLSDEGYHFIDAQKDCETCDGQGWYEHLNCQLGTASGCCGSCYQTVECDECVNGIVTLFD